MRGFRIKPNEKSIDLSKLDPNKVEFLCNMGVINKIIAGNKEVVWDQDKQDQFDSVVAVYFMVKNNLEYNVFYGNEFDEFLEKNNLKVNRTISSRAKKCIDHFINSLK